MCLVNHHASLVNGTQSIQVVAKSLPLAVLVGKANFAEIYL